MPDVDAVVVNWNGRDQTPHAIDSLLNLREVQERPDMLHVIVSDNGSTDASVELLRARYGLRISIVENGTNLGFAAGVNRAVPMGSAPFIFLLNPDATVRDGALGTLLSFMRAHPRCAIAGPAIFNDDGTRAQSCGEFDTWVGAFLRSSAWGELPLLRRWANGASLRGWAYDGDRRVDLVIGAAMMIRRSVFEELGGFDERFFMYHEEVDFAKRVAAAGYETWYVAAAQATHIGMGSTGGKNVERWKTASRRRYWIKHHGRVWYYVLSAALVARYVIYALPAAVIALMLLRLFH